MTASGKAPGAFVIATHGVFGSGGNMRRFARGVVSRRPEWGVVLSDLREHGRSMGLPGPHTVQAAAGDVIALANQTTGVRAVVGHSLGGKVAMEVRLAAPAWLEQTWVLDASPSAVSDPFGAGKRGQVPSVLAMLRELPAVFGERRDFETAVRERGFDASIAAWLAMNLDRQGEVYRFRLNLDSIRELLDSYYCTDSWDALSDELPGDVHVVIATRSSAFDAADRRRIASLAGDGGHLVGHLVDSAHWVHAEKPELLADLVAANLPEA